MIPSIVLINRSSMVSDVEIQNILPALQTQLSRDLKPWWGAEATLSYQSDQVVPAGSWPLWIMDHSDEIGDLGYHENTKVLVPDAKVFAQEIRDSGDELSTTISHEIIEMLVDPETTNYAYINGRYYCVEACDAVEADLDGYGISDVRVSNFVTPLYYNLSNPEGFDRRFDFMRLLAYGCPALRPGGYCMSYYGNQWHSTMARKADGSLGYRATRRFGRMNRRAQKPPEVVQGQLL